MESHIPAVSASPNEYFIESLSNAHVTQQISAKPRNLRKIGTEAQRSGIPDNKKAAYSGLNIVLIQKNGGYT